MSRKTTKALNENEADDLAKRIKAADDAGNATIFASIREHFAFKKKERTKTAPSRTFASLNPPIRVSGDEFVITKHATEKEQLLLLYTGKFERWWFEMDNGFSILLTGLGSKEWILDLFASCVSKLNVKGATSSRRVVDPVVCTLRGSSSRCRIGPFLDSLMREWLEWTTERLSSERRKAGLDWSLDNQCSAISRHAESTRRCLVLVVHSLDGDALRARDFQLVLSRLASCKNVRLIASIDNIHAQLMWTRREKTLYNFLTYDTTTYLPYTTETRRSSDPPVSVKTAEAITSSRGVTYIMKSLTPSHNEVLKEIGRRTLSLSSDQSGIPSSELLQFCLNKLWVRNEDAFKQFLGEFVDHDLIKRKRLGAKEFITMTIPPKVIRRDVLGETGDLDEVQ